MKQMQKSMEEERIYIHIFEQEFGRPLSPLECETLAMWLDQDDHNPLSLKLH